jgi:hypothetical protein
MQSVSKASSELGASMAQAETESRKQLLRLKLNGR